MALKSEKWFYGECVLEERGGGRCRDLAARALDLGLRNTENTTGHMRQAIGASQKFLLDNPGLVLVIRSADPARPLDLDGAGVLRDWLTYFGAKAGRYGGQMGYSWDTLENLLTPALGGSRRGGGGGDNEFEIALRLVAEFT